MDLRNHNDWNRVNGLLSVNMEPTLDSGDSLLHVMLNGSTGNFCLDYKNEEFDKELSIQRAWSSDTGYYVKILPNNNVKVIRWWDRYEEELPFEKVNDNPQKFYEIITKHDSRSGSIIVFAKEAFLRLRNCVQQSENGQESLTTFMYLLAALEDNVQNANDVDRQRWHLANFDQNWISTSDWQWLYNAFKSGMHSNGHTIQPLVRLILRHASNRLFQEAHKEATRKVFQTAMFEGASRKYDSGISDGAYYTPTPLVRTIVQEALWALNKVKPLAEREHLRILDPACGSAEFLREALRQLKILKYNGSISIHGWDISEIACEMSRFVLHYESRTEWNNTVEIIVDRTDSLTQDWIQDFFFDVILMNPPFISFENLGTSKDVVIEKLGELVKRQPDGAALFWKNSVAALKDKGVLGLVLPHSFLSASTYEKLRRYIKDEEVEFSLIGRLGSSGLFEKAMIIPAILVGTKNVRSVANTVLWTDYQQTSTYNALRELRKYRLSSIPTPVINPSFSIYENGILTNRNNHNWTPTSFQIFELRDKLKNFTKVADIFSVTRGVDTGNNAAFLINKAEFLALPKKEQIFFRPCVMRESIVKGQLNDKLYVFYPYDKVIVSSEESLISKLPTYSKKLLGYKSVLKKRKNFDTKWWELSRRRNIPEVPKLISAYFGKAGYFAYDQNGEYIVGQSFCWLPKKEELNTELYYFAYLGLLHSPVIDKLLEMVCNVLDGGYYDLSKHYIDNMPLPDLSKANPVILVGLHEIGQLIHKGESFDKKKLYEITISLYSLNSNFI